MLEFVICEDEYDVKKIKDIIEEVMNEKKYRYNVILFDDYDESFKNYVSSNKKRVIYILGSGSTLDNGLIEAKYIRNFDKESIIIFLESYLGNMMYLERLNIFTYVLINNRFKKNLSLAIEEGIPYVIPHNDIVSFSDSKEDYTLSALDILYIVKDGRKTLIKTSNSEYEVCMSLDSIKKILPSYFRQSHRACLVNMNRVDKISCPKKSICFDNGSYIDYIGSKYKKDLIG